MTKNDKDYIKHKLKDIKDLCNLIEEKVDSRLEDKEEYLLNISLLYLYASQSLLNHCLESYIINKDIKTYNIYENRR